MTTMLISGCSHTAGCEILEAGEDAPDLAYGAHIAKHFGFDWVNISNDGASNEHIVNATINWVLSQPKDEYKDLVVLVGWSTVPRLSFYHEDHLIHTTPGLVGNKDAINRMIKNMGCGDELHELIEYYFGMLDHKTYINQWFNDIIYLDSFMKNNNIPYIMVNTAMHYYESFFIKRINDKRTVVDNAFYPAHYGPCDPCVTPNTEKILNDIPNYYKPTEKDYTFFEICKDFSMNSWMHFGADGHEYYAKHLIPIVHKIINEHSK